MNCLLTTDTQNLIRPRFSPYVASLVSVAAPYFILHKGPQLIKPDHHAGTVLFRNLDLNFQVGWFYCVQFSEKQSEDHLFGVIND